MMLLIYSAKETDRGRIPAAFQLDLSELGSYMVHGSRSVNHSSDYSRGADHAAVINFSGDISLPSLPETRTNAFATNGYAQTREE